MVRNLFIRNLVMLAGLLGLLILPSISLADDYSVVGVSSETSIVFHDKEPSPAMDVAFVLRYVTSLPSCELDYVGVNIGLYKENIITDTLISTKSIEVPMKSFVPMAIRDTMAYAGSYSFPLFDGDGHFDLNDGVYYFKVIVDPADPFSKLDPDGSCTESDETNNSYVSAGIDFRVKQSDFLVTSVSTQGPFAHLKDHKNPTIAINYSINYLDPPTTLIFCGAYAIPVKIELYDSIISRIPISTQLTTGKNCDNTFNFPLYEGDINFNLKDDSYFIKVTLDPDNIVIEQDEDNNVENSSIFNYFIASGDLYFGAVKASIDPGSDISILSTQYIINGTGSWTNSWGTYPIVYTDTPSIKRSINGDGYSIDLDSEGSVDVGNGTLPGTVNGMDIQLNDVSLFPAVGSDPAGMNYAWGTIELPEDVTYHKERLDSRIAPHGESIINFTGGWPVNDPASIQFPSLPLPYPIYFHTYGLPFYIKTENVFFDFSGEKQGLAFDIPSSKPVYVHETTRTALSARDYRKLGGFPSNDIPFSRGISTDGTQPYINGTGLYAGLMFEKSATCNTQIKFFQAQTHFPRGRLCWDNFQIKVNAGQLAAFEHGSISYFMDFKGECPDGNCGDPLETTTYEITPSASATTGDGALGGIFEGDSINHPTRWGKLDAGSGLYTYEKDDSGLTGALYVPGFIALDTKASSSSLGKYSVSQYLFGARKFNGLNKLEGIHYLNDPEDSTAKDGNQYFAGINMGPQILETGDGVDPGLTDLISDNDLVILFNGNSIQNSFSLTNYTKYIMRPGGITGVFNTNFADAISIYTYKLQLTRFAFRQVMNEMDDETFIDGNLDLPFPAGLHLGFSSLDITCTGDFAGGQVETEACDGQDNDEDGIIDEGCGEALSYWNIPVSYLGMEFKDQGGSGVCPNPNQRKLYLNTLNQVNGVSGKITLGSFWNSNGTPEEETMTAAAEMWMDSPDDDPAKGFAMVLEKGYLNHKISYPTDTSDGFTNLISQVDVPLFYDLSIHGHYVNKSSSLDDLTFDLYLSEDQSDTDDDFDGLPTGYASISDYRDLLGKASETMTPDPRPHAKYNWPSSKIIQLDYPLLYNESVDTKVPQFTGVKQNTNLPKGDEPVITLYSVPDYIKPDRTKLSFGISADVAALADFHVDLSSLTGDLDDFLSNQLGIGDIAGDSLEGMLGNLGVATDLMRDVTGGNITDLLAPAMDQVLDPLTNEGQPFDVLADLIRQAHNAPSLVTSQVQGLITSARDEVEDHLAAGLNSGLSTLYTSELAGFMAFSQASLDGAIASGNIGSLPTDIIEMRQYFESLKSNISNLKNILDQAADGIADARTSIETIQENTLGANGVITKVSGAINNIDTALGTLSDYTSPDPLTNPLFDPLETAQGYLNDAKTAIESLNIGAIANALKQAASLSGGSIDTSFLNDVEQFFDDRVDELDDLMDTATSNFQNLFNTADMNNLFDDANSRLAAVQGHVTGLETMLNQLFITVLKDMDNDGTDDGGYIGIVENSLNKIVSSLETLENTFTDLPVVSIPPGTDWTALEADGQDAMDIMARGVVEALAASGGEVGEFAASIDTNTDAFTHLFVDSFMGLVDAPINSALGELNSILDQALEEVVGGFIPDPDADDIKEFILSAILNSDQIQSINNNFFQEFGFISDYIDDLSGELTSQINRMITQAVAAVSEGLNSQMENITSGIGGGGGGLNAAKIDGYAVVSQEEVERFHLEAEFEFSGEPDPTVYWAALDITSWNAENGKGSGCTMDGTGLVDVAISTRDISADMLGTSLGIKEALLGFTLDGPVPIGIFGYVYTSGELDFEALVLSDMGLETGIGAIENYLGAKASGRFESYTISAAFYFGKSCDFTVLKRLDPEVATFLGERDGFTGVYVRGSAEVPILNAGCLLKVGVGCDIGAWYFAESPATYGGLLGGSAYGRVACLAALRGKVTLTGAKVGEEYNFSGSGWGAGGVGFCEPGKWSSISKSRSDSWCSTGDATFSATYKGSWSIDGPNVDCCF
jgi:hypothetical protein